MYVFLFTSQTTWSDTISGDHLGLLVEMDKKKKNQLMGIFKMRIS